MKTYRFYFLNREGQVFQAQNYTARGDESAKTTAHTLLANHPTSQSVEVWDIGRRVKIARRSQSETILPWTLR